VKQCYCWKNNTLLLDW